MLFDVIIDTMEDVLAIRAKAMEMMKEGKTIMEWESEGTRSQKSFTLPISEVLYETRLYLQRKAPDTYGRRNTRTVAKRW